MTERRPVRTEHHLAKALYPTPGVLDRLALHMAGGLKTPLDHLHAIAPEASGFHAPSEGKSTDRS